MGSCLIYINNLISAAAAIGFCFRSPGLRKAAWPAPAGIIKALPVSVAEAFAVCLAPGACTDVTASAAIAVIAASTSAVSTTTAIIAAVIIAAAIVAASAAKPPQPKQQRLHLQPHPHPNLKQHIYRTLLFYWFVLYHMGRADKVLLFFFHDFSVTGCWLCHKL